MNVHGRTRYDTSKPESSHDLLLATAIPPGQKRGGRPKATAPLWPSNMKPTDYFISTIFFVSENDPAFSR
jgi:hypothetical protein